MPHGIKGEEIIFSDVELISEVLKPGLKTVQSAMKFKFLSLVLNRDLSLMQLRALVKRKTFQPNINFYV